MKKYLIIVMLLLTGSLAYAQNKEPVIYNFEGMAFSSKGTVVANTDLQMRIWIRNQKAAGNIMYEEIQTVSTDQNGLFFLHIGLGKILNGSMATLASENNSRFMKIEMASIGETTAPGPIRFKCIKCRKSNDRYMPKRVEEYKVSSQ